jgi:acetyltransferase
MSIETLFNPKSIAVVGASRSKGKPGYIILSNIIEDGYTGNIIPVNPAASSLLGLDCYPSLTEYGQDVEFVISAVPAEKVKAVVDDCAKVNVKALLVIASGFCESGGGGAKLDRDIADLCRRRGIRLLGPNSLGFMNNSTDLNASFIGSLGKKGGLSLFSQSGSLCRVMLDMAESRHMGISKLVSLGNKSDISGSKLLSYLAEDEETQVIGGYLEDIVSGKDFIKAAEHAANRKPVIILKSGSTEAGRKATLSHTGMLASADTAFGAAFTRSGVTRADTFESLLDYGLAFSLQKPPRGKRVRIIADSGGPGILAADAIELAGMTVAMSFSASGSADRSSNESLPDNPVVVLGDVDPEQYINAIREAQHNSSFDCILLVLAPQALRQGEEIMEAIMDCCTDTPQTILCVLLGEGKTHDMHLQLATAGIPSFPTPERAVTVLKGMYQYGEWKQRPVRTVTRFKVNRRRVERILYRRQRTGRLQVGEVKGKDILGAYGFHVPQGSLASSAEEAVEIAERIGYPVAMKIVSPDIVHKSDLGGVVLGVGNAESVEDSFDLMNLKIRRRIPEARIEGVYVEKMANNGLEVIIGMNRDPQFGPMLMFGLGGIFVEVMKDVTFHLAPITEQEAIQMLKSTKSYAMLQGRRGADGVDIAAIASGLQRISQLTTDFPQIIELDINPFIVGAFGSEPVVADARMTLAPLPDEQ